MGRSYQLWRFFARLSFAFDYLEDVMIRNSLACMLILLFSTSSLAHDEVGSIGRTYFSCAGGYKLWNVHWFGVTGDFRSLQRSPTNLGPWSTQISNIASPSGTLSPGTNLQWYRAKHRFTSVKSDHTGHGIYHLLGADHYTSICWIPQQRCGGQRDH